MKTYSVKPEDIKRENHVVDATDKILGRIATEIATLLMGKHKALFSRNADIGDNVTVINAEKVKVTGKKPQQKMYYRHSNYPGGFRETDYATMMVEHPERIILFAVDGMLPQNHLHDKMMKRLKVYAGPEADRAQSDELVSTMSKPKKVKTSLIKNVQVKSETAKKKEAKR